MGVTASTTTTAVSQDILGFWAVWHKVRIAVSSAGRKLQCLLLQARDDRYVPATACL